MTRSFMEGGMPTDDILPGADLLVESASTLCMAASIQRIPIISVLSEVSKIRNVPVFCQREWEPVLQGVAEEVYGDANELAEAIGEILESGPWTTERQKEFYPGFQEKGEFARTIADILEASLN